MRIVSSFKNLCFFLISEVGWEKGGKKKRREFLCFFGHFITNDNGDETLCLALKKTKTKMQNKKKRY